MASLTKKASQFFDILFQEFEFPERVCLRLGTRSSSRGTEEYFDFVDKIDPFNDVIYKSEGKKILIDRSNDLSLGNTLIDFVESPPGLIFLKEKDRKS